MKFLFFKTGFYVSKLTIIHGNISTGDNGWIEGTVHGDVTAQANLTIEKNGTVNGNVHAKNVLVKGKIMGNVYCNGKVSVSKNGEVHGHIFAGEAIINKESLLKGGMAQLHQAANENNIQQEAPFETTTSVLADEPETNEPPQNWF